MKTSVPMTSEEPTIQNSEKISLGEPRLIFSNESERVYAFDKPESHYVRILLSESGEVVECSCTCPHRNCEHRKAELLAMRSEPDDMEEVEEDEFDEEAVARLLERMQMLDMGQLLTVMFDALAQHPEWVEYFQDVLPPINEDEEEEPLFS